MLDWTDRHCRYFLRLISRHTRLYTEMITTGAILHGDRDRLLQFHPAEHPLALQLGGSHPGELAECARIGEGLGYDEINLNLGCPSSRVQSGGFGACLMTEPVLVTECIQAMTRAVSIPVTAKIRIGVDERDSYEELTEFVRAIHEAGCEAFIVHARKAHLKGLSPKENRTIPPLNYVYVYRLKQDFPGLDIIINGGIVHLDDAERHLEIVDGVMVGRAAYHHPYFLAEVDARIFKDFRKTLTREEIVEQMLAYIDSELVRGIPIKHITRHMLGLFQGVPGARHWRRHLGQHAADPLAGPEIVREALALIKGNHPVAGLPPCRQQHG